MTPALKSYIESLLNKAEHDLLSAQRLLEIEPMILDNACFDPVFAAIDPININAYAVQGRYPDSNLIPAIDEAKSYYQLAIHVRDLVAERIVFP